MPCRAAPLQLLLARSARLGDVLQHRADERRADAARAQQQPHAAHEAVGLGREEALLARNLDEEEQREEAEPRRRRAVGQPVDRAAELIN